MSTKQSSNNVKQNKKRKRQQSKHNSSGEQYQTECTERYGKLYHLCSKQLHKEAKVVKSFECQKIVRAIKTANETIKTTQNSKGGHGKMTGDAKMKKVKTLEQKLERTKKLDLDVLVQIALKRLGVLSLDPSMSTDSTAEDELNGGDELQDKQKDGVMDENASGQAYDSFYQSLIETMLRHKRLSTAMDQINEKITDYNSWAAHREEMLQSDGSANDCSGKNAKKKKKQKQQARDQNDTLIVAGSQKRRKMDLGGHEGTSGLFIGSLSGQKVEGYSDDEDAGEYGAYGNDDGDLFETKKKNRPGQRARKAKAMAIEARRAGTTWDSSVNWREKKENVDQEDSGARRGENNKINSRARGQSGDTTKAVSAKSQDIATMGKTWKEEGKAHPSWAAAAAQKSQSIAKFQGTKITFG